MSRRDEVTALLQALLRLDTVNPPGNETRAAHLLRDYLAGNGIEAELYARVPERANLVARVKGGDGPSLAFLCHTDTVLADPAEWDRDPWSGDLVDGEVWGRGALDMKDQVAANAVAFASLAREGFEPAGDLVFIATADEEVGGDGGYGLVWLCAEHPEAARCDYAINEGAGDRLLLDGTPVYLAATAEKMSAPFTIRVHGRSGHASMPGIADNALVKASALIERLAAYRPERTLAPETAALVRVLTGEEAGDAEQALERARAVHPLAGDLVEPLLSMTLSPTMIQASQKRNVIPARCDVTVDCRLLPGQLPADVEPLIREVLGEGSYGLEWIEAWGGTRSTMESPLWDVVASFVEELEPGAVATPVMVAGFTDSHWLREAFGTVAYGFFPMRTMDPELAARLIHSADERAHVDDLALGASFLREAAQAVLG
jgi:acetylornithine deacetylase/succinyl-diaminopimelate desuccinylase-like protein